MRELRALQKRIASAIRAATPRAPHRDGSKGKSYAGAPTGGSLADKVSSPRLVVEKPWGGVLRLYDLGQVFLWFVEGTKTGGKRVRRGKSQRRIGGEHRQPPRPIPLTLERGPLVAALEQDAAKWLEARDAASEERAA